MKRSKMEAIALVSGGIVLGVVTSGAVLKIAKDINQNLLRKGKDETPFVSPYHCRECEHDFCDECQPGLKHEEEESK